MQQSAPHLYTTANIPLVNANCGYYSDLENQYILTGESELMDFQTNTGVDVSVLVEQVNEFIENRGGYEDYSYDDFIYIIRVDTVNSTGYYLKSDGLIYDGENYTFALSSECKIPGADEIVGDMMDGFCYMAAIPYLDSDN